MFNKQRTGNVEEVERHSIHDHGKNQHPQTGARITEAEQSETEYPGKHTDQHHLLDTKMSQEEWYSENK